jgi:hypothetical protein
VALRRADHSSKESYRLYKNDYETEEEARDQQMAIDSLMNSLIIVLVSLAIKTEAIQAGIVSSSQNLLSSYHF